MGTDTANLSAQTATGGIEISNNGNVNINGGVIPGVNGLHVTDSGDVYLIDNGNITANTNGDIISGPHQVRIVTVNYGNICLGGNNGSGVDGYGGTVSSTSDGGWVDLDPAGNLLIGDTATQTYGDVTSRGDISIGAGIGVNIDEGSSVSAHGSGRINVSANINNIQLLHTTPSMPAASLTTEGGAISISTTSYSSLVINSDAAASGLHSISTTLKGGNGNITIQTGHFILNDATDDITAGTGVITIEPTYYENIQLGTTTDSEFDISNAELGKITAGRLNIGSPNSVTITLTAPITTPNVSTLTLQTGYGESIIANSAADILSTGTLALSASSGIGSAGVPLPIQVNNLSAETTNGAIFISNSGDLNISGGAIAGLNGIAAPSGNIVLSATGSINIATSLDNVNAGGAATVTAGQDLLISSSLVEAHGTGTATAIAGRNITLTSGYIYTDNGAITVSTGADGIYSSGNEGIIECNNAAPISISADDFIIDGRISAGGGGTVTLQQATTTSRNIDLGGGTTAGDVGLSNAELGQIIAATVRIGRIDNSGSISVTAPVTMQIGNTISLLSGGSISDNASTETIRTTNLAVQADSGISLDTQVSNVAAHGDNIRIANTGALTVTAVDTLNGLIGAPINISAGTIAINGPVYAGTIGAVTLTPTSGDVNLASVQFITGGSITQTAGVSTSSYAGTLTASSGGIHLTGNKFTLAGPITDTGSLVLNDTGTATLTGSLAVSGPIIMNGAGAFQLNSRLPATVSLAANAGTTTIGANPGTGIRELNFTALNVAAGAKLVLAQSSATNGDYSNHGNRTVVNISPGGLSIATGGILDMGDNDMILHYTSANETAARNLVSGLLASGFDGGGWDTCRHQLVDRQLRRLQRLRHPRLGLDG